METIKKYILPKEAYMVINILLSMFWLGAGFSFSLGYSIGSLGSLSSREISVIRFAFIAAGVSMVFLLLSIFLKKEKHLGYFFFNTMYFVVSVGIISVFLSIAS